MFDALSNMDEINFTMREESGDGEAAAHHEACLGASEFGSEASCEGADGEPEDPRLDGVRR